VPSSVGGQVVATIGGETVDRWPTDSSGEIDRWVDVPDRLLQRYTTLAVQVNIAGDTGSCGQFQPVTLTIDGDSAITSSAATPPVPSGFQSMPQALMPRVQIGINDDIFGDTQRAVQIMTGLQRLSALPIDTAVMPLQQAIDSGNPAVLISPEGWPFDKVKLPIAPPDAVSTTLDAIDDDGNPTTLTLDPALRFASLQTVVDGNRSLLVATSTGAPEQLDELLRWLGRDVQRWSAVNGVALISVAERDPVTITVPDAVAAPAEAATQSTSSAQWWAIIGGLLAIVLVVTVVLVLRDRRSARTG
jgi:predicted transcriptional regulator